MLGKPPEEAEKEAARSPTPSSREQVADALELGDDARPARDPQRGAGGRAARLQPAVSRRARSSASPGVAGAGHHEVLELVCGMRRPDAGLGHAAGGRDVPRGLRRAIRSGVALVSGDRRRLGLMLDKPLGRTSGRSASVGLAADGPIVRCGRLRERARAQVEGLRIRSRSVDQTAGLALGRQPAEGRVRQVARRPAVGDPARRPDPRRRRRRQGGDARADPLRRPRRARRC